MLIFKLTERGISMKQLVMVTSLMLVFSLLSGCGGGSSNSSAEETANSVMKAIQSGNKDAFMALAYAGNVEDILDEMDEYEEFWQDIEEAEGLSIDSWTTPVVLETMPEDEAEGDIIGGVLMETVVSLTFEGDHETENIKFLVVQTAEGWFIAEIDA